MGKVRFALTLHNHQPVGNFDEVIEGAYQDGYLPFLEVLEQHPWMPITLHTSGCLMEWLAAHKPEYIQRLRALVDRKQVEILGGGFYEPIMTMIPSRDRQGQIRGYSEYLDELFGCRVRGMWTPERVWEQSLVKDIVAAGVEYTILDDFHFQKAGFANGDLVGSYVTEDEGTMLRIVPGSEPMRYLIPFQEVGRAIDYLRDVHQRHNDALVVFADDGEKFGSWPNTKEHCYARGWLHQFFEALRRNSDWLQVCTVGQALSELEPLGRVYLPDCSYREMTEWSLPTERRLAYQRAWRELESRPESRGIQEFLRAGSWRNFKVRYPETNEMYARMLDVSRRLERLCSARPESLGDARLNAARTELYRGQCNCAYWHGAFGGLYLPHLRNAVYGSLIRAENRLIEFERGPRASFVSIENRDFNLDGRIDVRMDNEHLAAFFDPAAGGMLYELDLRSIAVNLGSSLSRRPEEYHERIRQSAGQDGAEFGRIHGHMIFKQDGLADRLVYDPYPRKSLIDHFYALETTLQDVAAGKAVEQGDFVAGKFKATTAQSGDQVLVSMARRGKAFDRELMLSKAASLGAGQRGIRIRYRLENLPLDRPMRFAVEWNFAALAAGADDRYFQASDGRKLSLLGAFIDETSCSGIGLVDEWLGVKVGLTVGKPAGIWSFPIQSVSQSEGGYELVHQSVCLLAYWDIPAGSPAWEVEMALAIDASRAAARLRPAVELTH